MNKIVKYLFIVLGIITFIEVQVGLFFIVKTYTIVINKSESPNIYQDDRRQNFRNSFDKSYNSNNNQVGIPDDDISNNAITPDDNITTKDSSNKSKTNKSA